MEEGFKDFFERHRLKQVKAEQQRRRAAVSTITEVLAERGSRYGDFDKHAEITQKIKKVMRGCEKWESLSDSQKESLEMVAHKIGRILNGDPNYRDSWVDIEGYVKLVSDELKD